MDAVAVRPTPEDASLIRMVRLCSGLAGHTFSPNRTQIGGVMSPGRLSPVIAICLNPFKTDGNGSVLRFEEGLGGLASRALDHRRPVIEDEEAGI